MYTKTVKDLQCFILLDLIFLNSEAQGGTSSPNFMSPGFFSSSNTVSFYKTIAMWTSAWRHPGLQETAFTKNKTPGNVRRKGAATHSPVGKQQQDVFSSGA